METKTSLTPKFFFLSAGVLIGLITVIVSGLTLFFETLNSTFPDALAYVTSDFDAIRAALSTLIIFFPVYLVISYFWNKQSAKELSRSDAAVRKWVIYLILFLAAIVAAVDLIVVVRYFVSGEITIRFILKVLGVLVAAGIVGWHYILALRPTAAKLSSLTKTFAIVSSILVVGLITYSFLITGSPTTQRNLRFDTQRVSDLDSIQSQVTDYWQKKQKLPESLDVLSTQTSDFSIPQDPEVNMGKAYEYKLTGPMSFDVCATFSLPSPKDRAGTSIAYPYGGLPNKSWDHQAGHVCFPYTIDKDLNPPYPKQ